jgi:hypothetical protein
MDVCCSAAISFRRFNNSGDREMVVRSTAS